MSHAKLIRSASAEIELTLPKSQTRKPDTLAVAWRTDNDNGALEKLDHQAAIVRLRGFGASKIGPAALSKAVLHDYMDDFHAAIEEAGGGPVNLIGYSQGGYFATTFALKNPSLVKSLVLVEPAFYTDRAELIRRAELADAGQAREAILSMISYTDRSVALDRDGSNTLASQIAEHAQHSDVLAQQFRLRADNPITDADLAHLKIPVLLIGGTESRTADFVTRAAKAIPYAAVWWVKGATHLSLMDSRYAPQISSAVNAFLAVTA